jgi:catechol-2,3-dioxygenase
LTTARVTATRVSHGALRVLGLDASIAFYGELLRLEVVARNGDVTALLRLPGSSSHHDLALVVVGVGGGEPPRPAATHTGLHHLAWEVATLDDLGAAHDLMRSNGSLLRETDHGVSKSMHGVDPSGNEFEILWSLPSDEWGDLEHLAIAEPLDLDKEMATRRRAS